MRTIKFRVWDDIEKKYTYPGDGLFCVTQVGSVCIDFTDNGGILDNVSYRCNAELSTGLHDKNGKEIYEGDILYSPYRNWKISISIGEAKYIGCGVKLTGVISTFLNNTKEPEPFMYNSGTYDWGVVGNVHQSTS